MATEHPQAVSKTDSHTAHPSHSNFKLISRPLAVSRTVIHPEGFLFSAFFFSKAFEIFSSGRSDSRGYLPGRDVGQKERLESYDGSGFLQHHRRFSKAAIAQSDSRAPFL
ncbi:hypothetical protein RUM44_008537 [Polyplax serrata]|uniref:Uncharacterized protein n=1 Tax=Polyplax serrata TaxID=468196 RepID=A0ABR1B8T1_POLSC